VIYRAAAALPDDDRQSAVDGLRGQLRIMAVAAGATPDWTTLVVAGPVEMADAEDRTRFEWTASVAVRGATVLDDLPDPDALPPAGTVDDATMAFCLDGVTP
jgi:hypothetical protein